MSQEEQMQRIKRLQDRTNDLCNESTDGDEAINWSHYNGVFSALYTVLANGGQFPESVLFVYEQYVQEFGGDEVDE